MDFVVIYRALLRKKWLILGVSFFAMLLAFVLTINYKATYKSTAQLATGFTVAEQVSVVNEKFNLFEADVKFNNLIETINSPKVFSRLSYKLLLHDMSGERIPFREIKDEEKYKDVLNGVSKETIVGYTKQKLDSSGLLSVYDKRDIQLKELLKLYKYNPASLKDVINISRVRGTDYISIESFTEVAELSSFLSNTLIEVFLEYNSSLRNERSSESAETFAALLKQKKLEMQQKSEELKAFKSSNRVLNFQMESSSIIEQISELENKKNEQKRKVQGLSYEIDDLNDRIRDASKDTNSNSNSSANAEIIELRELISNINGRFIATGSSNRMLLDSLQLLRNSLQKKLVQSGSGSNTNTELEDLIKKRQEKQVNFEIARQDLNSLESNLRILRGNAGGYASKEASIASLERELEMATEEYQSAQEKYNTALDVTLASGSNVRQILEAQPADQPEPSKRLIITGLSGFSSFILCVIVIVFMEYIDVSIKSPSNFKRLTGLKLLGILLSVNNKQQDLIGLLKRTPPPKKLFQFNDVLRKMRYEIEALGAKKILVTSTQPQQGKTSLILSLAATLSNVKRKVLIIDSNFTNNELTRILKGKQALENSLNTEVEFRKNTAKSKFEYIYILGSQGGNYSPSEVLNLDCFFKELDGIAKNFDYILFEGGALNNYSDSKELGKHVDAVIGVFSANSIIRQTDQESISYLSSLGKKFVGGVLNEVEVMNLDQ